MVYKELCFGIVLVAVLQCIQGQVRDQIALPAMPGLTNPGLANPGLTQAVKNLAGGIGKTTPLQQQGLVKLAQALARQKQLRQQQRAQRRNPMDMWLNMQLFNGELEGPMRMYALLNLMKGGGAGGAGGMGGGLAGLMG